MDVAAWLREIGLGQYASAFRDNDIDASLLPTLTAEELRELGVMSLGHRKRLLAEIAALPTRPAAVTLATPERRRLTVMFVDLANSTALSARLDPEDMRAVLRDYQKLVTGEVARAGGHVAKLMGDGVLAYFGWPHASEDDAEAAVRSGLAIARAVDELRAPDSTPLAARVGIATGLVVVGELIGDGAAREESVVGETPNLAARLQAAAKPGGVLVSDGTRRLLGESFELRALGSQALKGVPRPVTCFEVVREHPLRSRFEARRAGSPLPMVGRGRELAFLQEQWRRAIAGDGQTVLVVGDAGIGKSRLVRALLDEVDAGDDITLRCQCSPRHVGTPLWPVVQQLTFACGFEPTDTDAAKQAKLKTLLGRAVAEPDQALPFIATLLDIEAELPTGLTPRQLRDRTLRHLLDQLLGLTRHGPVLLVVEDVHWVDATTLELLSELMDRIGSERVLILLTSRPDVPPGLRERSNLLRVMLNRLDFPAIAAIVEHAARTAIVPPAILAQIAARSDGVPLFVEELTKAVVETDVVGPKTAVPATLEASLLARLDRAGEAKEAAQIAACIGREFDHPLLATVWSSSPRELDLALERLVAAELVFRRGTPPDARYMFKHALVRDAAHESLLRSQRQALHRRIVGALEEQFPETARHEPELLAHHCAEAGLCERAVDYRLRAGQLALARCSMSEATTQLSEGLTILERLPDGPGRQSRELALLVALGQASIAARGFAAPETGRLYARARELCLGMSDPPELMPILYGQSVFHMQRSQYTAAYGVAEELRLAAERHDDTMALVTAHRMMGSALTQLGRLDESRREFATALRLHDPERHRSSGMIYAIDSRVMCLSWLSHVLHLSGEPGPALESHLEALSWARSLGHASSSVVALAWGCIYQQLRGDHELAGARAREAVTAAAEHGFPLYHAAALVVGGWARAQRGDLDAGLAAIVNGIGDYMATGATMWLPYFLALQAALLARAGRPSEGLDCVRDALERINRTQGRWIEPELLRLRARLEAGSVPDTQNTEASHP